MMKFTTIAQAKKETGLSYLGTINSSAKIIKNQKVSNNYTYILYLAPANLSGYDVCPFSTHECRMGCLNTSGRAMIDIISDRNMVQNSRIKKTKLFYEHPEFFMQWMIEEIKMYQRKAIKDGYDFSVRLNGTSDIDWANVIFNGKNIFDTFKDVQFYDYTKNPYKFRNKPANYHLTLSYTGNNWVICKTTLKKGNNVAIVFDTKKNEQLPETYNGFPIINGDLTDYRPNDGKGVIVGLRWKKIANKQAEKMVLNSDFVVKTKDLINQLEVKKTTDKIIVG